MQISSNVFCLYKIKFLIPSMWGPGEVGACSLFHLCLPLFPFLHLLLLNSSWDFCHEGRTVVEWGKEDGKG